MLLVGFYFGEMEVNKQQLIDKAIDDLRLAEEDPFFGKKFLCRTQLTDGRFAYYGTDYPQHHADDLVCSKHEFQASKAEREALTSGVEIVNQARKELGLENAIINKQWQIDAIESKIAEIKSREWVDELIATTNHWYDYKNQKALRFPPVGEVVELKGTLEKVRIVAHDEGKAVFCICSGGGYDFDHADNFVPIGLDKEIEIKEIAELIFSNLAADNPIGIARSILAAGYRKCDNNTSSDKE